MGSASILAAFSYPAPCSQGKEVKRLYTTLGVQPGDGLLFRRAPSSASGLPATRLTVVRLLARWLAGLNDNKRLIGAAQQRLGVQSETGSDDKVCYEG